MIVFSLVVNGVGVMKQHRVKEGLSIIEAVDILSSLAEIQGDKPSPHAHRWLDQKQIPRNQEMMKEVFLVIRSYLEHLCQPPSYPLKDPQIRQGIVAIQVLLQEAVEKLTKHTELFRKEPVANVQEYEALQEYFLEVVAPKIQEEEVDVREELGIQEEELGQLQQPGIQDLEDIKEDHQYELFYLRREDQKPFYQYDMIRRLHLLYHFDQAVSKESSESLFAKILLLQDHECSYKACQILKEIDPLVKEFYARSIKAKEHPLVRSLNKALIALRMAASDQPKSQKSAFCYFRDFHAYIRESLHTAEYRGFSSIRPEKSTPLTLNLFLLIHTLCSLYFLTLSHQRETVMLIQQLMQRKQGKEIQEKSFWEEWLQEDAALRRALQKDPHGPMRRIIQAFLRGDVHIGWDPMAQGNLPSKVFSFSRGNEEISFIKMPSPLKQTHVQKAEESEEFKAFLTGGSEKFLFVNLQDRTSWQEQARAKALEDLSDHEELSKLFFVLGIPKNTEFYAQKGSYQSLSEATLFRDQLAEQCLGGELCGFHWPKSLQDRNLDLFILQTIQMIHELFFSSKQSLSFEERQGFIDLFYFFLILKAIDQVQPRFLAISCKDGIDVGASSSALFFSFLRLLTSEEPWKEEEKEFLLWLLYSPALLLRERAIHLGEVTRLVSSVKIFQQVSSKDLLRSRCKELFLGGVVDRVWMQRN